MKPRSYDGRDYRNIARIAKWALTTPWGVFRRRLGAGRDAIYRAVNRRGRAADRREIEDQREMGGSSR
jgi:hypothetical protein